ncbi:Uncharacterised protein [Campylobacter devanensis]|uniref:hypothetical protein n=1 Tax=Campylobacter TaxID=194 RepID=UPI0003D93807|nr:MULTISPECIES: hypothetical protein [Campylobacter]AHE95184.1 hypothetical protein CFVI03293_A0057 [Campylobacter fetus subsp. venerealis cfvi03/293]KAA3682584.1 hypothetical protein E3U40_10165 [Campylobacter fetus subsp. venerealis]MBK3487678.1 hypothetical protein [Campylobacter fetus subsp. venerealis]SUX05162.1 Uncharacterised protein [Campylobacter lanienae]
MKKEEIEIDFLEQANKSESSFEQEDAMNDYNKYRKVFPITIVLDEDDLNFFNEYCHKNYLKRSAVARQLVNNFFDNFKG